jgi:hypothetical protein
MQFLVLYSEALQALVTHKLLKNLRTNPWRCSSSVVQHSPSSYVCPSPNRYHAAWASTCWERDAAFVCPPGHRRCQAAHSLA